MKVAIILNTLNNYHKAKMGLGVTLNNAGYDFDLFWTDNGSNNDRIKDLVKSFNPKYAKENEENVGNPVSYNQMLIRVKEGGYSHVMFLAPDVVLPKDWLKICVELTKKTDLKGLLGFEWGYNQKKTVELVEGVPLLYADYVFGCWFLPVSFLDEVGYINERYKIYGKWDADLNFRASAKGIKSYYLPLQCIHLDSPLDNNTEYRKMKDKWLRHNEQVHKEEVLRYAKENNYYIEAPDKI